MLLEGFIKNYWSAFFTINSFLKFFFKNSLNSHLFYGESLWFTFRRETWTSGETWDQREPDPTFGVNFHVSSLVHGSRHGVRRKLWRKNWDEGSCLTVVCTSLQLAYPIRNLQSIHLPSQNEVDARVAVQFGDNRTLFVLPN